MRLLCNAIGAGLGFGVFAGSMTWLVLHFYMDSTGARTLGDAPLNTETITNMAIHIGYFAIALMCLISLLFGNRLFISK